MELPPDLTRLIFEFSDDEELAKLCMLNKSFSTKVCNSYFWMNKITSRFGLKPEEIREFKGNNTLWAYYNHLSELNKYRRWAGYYGPAQIERIYNHPFFKAAAKNIFVYYENPKWLNKTGFEEDMLYQLIDMIIEYIIENYDGTRFRVSDIATYGFLSSATLLLTPELKDYMDKILKESGTLYYKNNKS